MDTTRAQQQALDDELATPADRLKIGKSNLQLNSTLKSKEPTLQVVLDALKLTLFYNAFEISADVPEIYMQEFWVTVSRHHSSLRFKLNGKIHTVNVENFKDMLKICPKLPGQKFEEPPLEVDILTFIRDLGDTGEIKFLSDVNVNHMHQPWRSFAAIINKCLSGKTTALESLRLSRAQILWGMYHNKKVDYVYLLWEDLVFQVENKNSKKNNDMYYPRFTKVIIDYFMAKDKAIPRRNKMFWHHAGDDFMFTTEKRIKCSAKGDKAAKKKQPVETSMDKGLTLLSNVALTEAKQLKLVIKRSKTQTHSSHASGSGADEGTCDIPGVPDVPTYGSDDEQISWKSSEEDDEDEVNVSEKYDDNENNDDDDDADNQDDENQDEEVDDDDEQTDSDNDGDNFVHPKFSTHDDEARQEEPISLISSIPDIVDAYLANKMIEAIKTVVQLQSDRLKDEAQAKNKDFLNKLDDNIKKIIKEQVKEQVKAQVSKILPKIKKTVNEQLKAEVMTRSSTESKTSLAIAANLSELKLKKILIENIESNRSSNRSNEQKNLYKALVEAYKSDKLILDTYGDTVSFKRRRDDEDKDKEPSAGSNWGSKRRRARKELESTSAPKEKTSKTAGKSTDGSKSQHKSAGESAHTEEPMHTNKDLEEPAHKEFDIGATKEQSEEETSQHPDWFQKPAKLPTPDRDWNKTLLNAHGLLKVDTLTPKLLVGPTFKLMKGSCKSLIELEYLFEEVYKATTDQLDWINPEGQQYPHDLRKPLPLIPNTRGRRVIPFDHFINNDLEYLSGEVSSRRYATSITKTKAADYGHIKWIKDFVPNLSQVLVSYDKHALWGISHWGCKRQQFYRFAANRESAKDVYSKRRIIAVTKIEIVEWHNYKHLDWITVYRDDDKLYKFKEGDFNRLRIRDIEDMLLLLVQGKLTNLAVKERLAFNVSFRMFTRSIVIQRRVEDLQLGVKSYQKKLNLTKPDTYRPDLKRRKAYTAYSNPRGFVYQNKEKKNILMHIDELHKFSDGTLDDVQTALNDRLKGIWMMYLPQTIWRQRDKDNAGAMIQEIDKQLKTRRIMQSLEKFIGGRPYEERFYTLAGNPVKEILLKLNLPDHRILKDGGEVKEFQRSFCHSDTERLSRSDEVLKLKNFKKDATLKLFKSTNQERYEHVGPEVISSQDGQGHKMAKKRLCLVDDLKVFKITFKTS
ncbi:hypothetical protein Tco_0205115 [Tanacetum coccineum]